MNFSWKKGLLLGLLIWVVMFAIVSALIGFKVYGEPWGKALIVVLDAVVVFYCARNVKPANLAVGFWYAACWTVIGVVLDALVTLRFNPAIFQSLNLWVGYAVGFLVALFGYKFVPKK